MAGRAALVTGGSSGIGLAIARALGQDGYALTVSARRPDKLEEAVKGRRRVDYATEGVHDADIYAGELLDPGMSFEGPAIVETSGMTVVVHPGNEVQVDDYGNVIIAVTPE